MSLMDRIREKAKQQKMTIVLPEGTEPRTIAAAARILEEDLANLVLIGNPGEIANSNTAGLDLSKAQIIHPPTSPKLQAYADAFYELRKAKGIRQAQALETVQDPLYYAVMMIREGDADGMVSGAVHSTGDTLRPALQVIKTAPGAPIVSSCFIMEVPDTQYGDDGVLLFADCAINIDPDPEQLAAIAVETANSARNIAGIDPRVAMLSFSTKGSAKHPEVEKVQEAAKIAHEINPELLLDGELQADAALVESVGALKCPGSPVAGHANVLIFPNLAAGNIGYKLVQRLAGATAVGPICQGLARPVNDLSRGCSVQDIVDVVAITAVQAQQYV